MFLQKFNLAIFVLLFVSPSIAHCAPLPQANKEASPPNKKISLTPHKTTSQKRSQLSTDLDLKNIDRAHINDFFDKIPIQGVDLNQSQTQSLKHSFGELVYAYGRENMSSLLIHLQLSGHTVSHERMDLNRNLLTEVGDVKPDNLTLDGWGLMNQVADVFNKKSRWAGLSLGGGTQIDSYVYNQSNPAIKQHQFYLNKKNRITINPWTTPPVTPEHSFALNNEIRYVQITLFVKHAKDSGGRIEPYVMEYWYDPANKIWHPTYLSYFPNTNKRYRNIEAPFF